MNLTLRFEDEAESEFLDRFFDRSIGQMRFAIVLGIFLYAIFGVLDAIAAPAEKTQIWISRYAIVCPILAVVLATTYTRPFRRQAHAIAEIFSLPVPGPTVSDAPRPRIEPPPVDTDAPTEAHPLNAE